MPDQTDANQVPPLDRTIGRRAARMMRRDLLPSLMLGTAVITAFSGALGGEFLNWDDQRNFVQNHSFRGLGLDQFRWAFTTFHLGVWQPLAWMLFSLQYTLFGLEPRGYHVVSLALHVLCVVLIYRVVNRCLALRDPDSVVASSRSRWIAALVVACFALHPLRVETVAWISCQPYLPSILCCLLCVAWSLRFHSSGEGRGTRAWAVPLAYFALAVGFKAVAVTLPLVLVILDGYPLRRWRRGASEIRRSLIEKVPMLMLAVVVCWLALRAKEFNASRAPLHEFDASARAAQAIAGIWFYLIKTIAPYRLSPYYRLPGDLSLGRPLYLAALVGLIVLTAAFWRWRRAAPSLITAWLIYLVVLMPNLGLIQISQQLAADRYSYLALIGSTVVVAGGLTSWLSRQSRAVCAAVAAFLIVASLTSAIATNAQTKQWRTSESLWRSALAVDPDGAVAHCNLGEDLVRRGEYVVASRHLSRAIDLDASFAFAYANLGVVLVQARRFEDAVRCGEQALAIDGGLAGLDRARAHAMLGQAYAGLRRDDEARRHTQEAWRLGFEPARDMLNYLSEITTSPSSGAPTP